MLSLVEMNDVAFAHFRRVTGSGDRFQFVTWWAQRERDLIEAQADGFRPLAAARWACLTHAEQQGRMLHYLQSLDPMPVCGEAGMRLLTRAA